MKKFMCAVLFMCISLTCIFSLYTRPTAGMAAEGGTGDVYVQNYISGDVNGDGTVNTADCGMLLQYMADWDITFAEKAAGDMNADNKINMTDTTLVLQMIAGWDVDIPVRTSAPVINIGNYSNKADAYLSSYGAKDALGRTTLSSGGVNLNDAKSEKYVGIFYFLWLGAHGLDLYDNTKIVEQYSDALRNANRWGPVGAAHFWGEPLFGYYVSSDKWVMRKHIQMLTDAGVDFIVFDTTNSTGTPSSGSIVNNGGGNNTYVANALAIMKILKNYYDQGWDVPKVAFYTNSNSGGAMNVIYNEVYKAHPEYSDIWFNWEGKPMIVGISGEASSEVKSFFRIKESQWPNAPKNNDGFPWMEFGRLLSNSSVYKYNGKKIMNVSIAQHNSTVRMSSAAWYGGDDRTRSYSPDYGGVRKETDAVLYGYNFASQWEYALKKDPDMIFITGWNEWVAQRQPSSGRETIVFVDNANIEASRDAEPMRGGYGDNYYMQMIDYIRQYKGIESTAAYDNDSTIDISGEFGQWDYIRAVYRDYKGDTAVRQQSSFGGIVYENMSGVNDIVEAKVCNDKDYVYFFVKTNKAISEPSGECWMNLYIKNGLSETPASGYDFVLNHTLPGDKAVLERFEKDGSLSEVARVDYKISKKMMMVAIPCSALGLSQGTAATLEFKWADACVFGDEFSFYTDGDAAPIGRLNYVYEFKTI